MMVSDPFLPAANVLMGIPATIKLWLRESHFSDVWKSWEPSLFPLYLFITVWLVLSSGWLSSYIFHSVESWDWWAFIYIFFCWWLIVFYHADWHLNELNKTCIYYWGILGIFILSDNKGYSINKSILEYLTNLNLSKLSKLESLII